MDYYTIRRMRTSKSDHSVMQDARIDALLKEMQPGRHNRSLQISNNTDFQPAPPNYDVIFPQKHAPPPYSQLVRRTVNSTWNVDFESEPENFPTWTMNANQLATMEKTTTHNSLMSTISLPNGVVSKSVLPPRNSPRQASFIAAMSRHEQYATMRCCVRQQTTPQLSRRTAVNHTTTQTSRRENRRTTVFGDRIFSKESSQPVSCRDMNHNAVTKMRRARPKSYVLATSTSFPETEQMSFSQDESRELSSLGSLSSIDRTPRLANREHNHSHAHRIQKFIAFFTHQNSPTKLRAKRSLTSLPLSRDPLPTTVLRASKLIRQGWLRHQELALGKSGKRRSWEECWAMLYEQSLYLCAQEPVATIAETTGEKVVSRVDLLSLKEIHFCFNSMDIQ